MQVFTGKSKVPITSTEEDAANRSKTPFFILNVVTEVSVKGIVIKAEDRPLSIAELIWEKGHSATNAIIAALEKLKCFTNHIIRCSRN